MLSSQGRPDVGENATRFKNDEFKRYLTHFQVLPISTCSEANVVSSLSWALPTKNIDFFCSKLNEFFIQHLCWTFLEDFNHYYLNTNITRMYFFLKEKIFLLILQGAYTVKRYCLVNPKWQLRDKERKVAIHKYDCIKNGLYWINISSWCKSQLQFFISVFGVGYSIEGLIFTVQINVKFVHLCFP